jgi:hypothetical protein
MVGLLIGLGAMYLYMEQKNSKQREFTLYLYKSVNLSNYVRLMQDYEESSIDGLLTSLKNSIDCNGYYIREEINKKERAKEYHAMFFIPVKEYANKYHDPERECHAKTRKRLGLIK